MQEKQLQITNDMLAINLKNIEEAASLDIRDMFNEDGTVKPVHEWPPAIAKNVTSLKFSAQTGKLTNVSLSKVMDARRLFAQMVGQLAPDDKGPNVSNTVNVIIQKGEELATKAFKSMGIDADFEEVE